MEDQSICSNLSLFKRVLSESRKGTDDKLKLHLNSITKLNSSLCNTVFDACQQSAHKRIVQIEKCIEILCQSNNDATKFKREISILTSELETENILTTIRNELRNQFAYKCTENLL